MKFLVLIFLVLNVGFVNAATPPELFDEEFKFHVEKRFTQAWKACKDKKNMGLKSDCISKESKKYDESTKAVRFTDAYRDAHYGTLAPIAAKKKLKEIKKLWGLARKHHLSQIFSEPGELNYDLLELEITYLKTHIKNITESPPTLAEEAEKMGLPGMANRIRKLTNE